MASTTALTGKVPVCIACGDTDPGVSDDGLTACCGQDLVAFTCTVCGSDVYFGADGSEPDTCPHPHRAGADERHTKRLLNPRRPRIRAYHFGGLFARPCKVCGKTRCAFRK